MSSSSQGSAPPPFSSIDPLSLPPQDSIEKVTPTPAPSAAVTVKLWHTHEDWPLYELITSFDQRDTIDERFLTDALDTLRPYFIPSIKEELDHLDHNDPKIYEMVKILHLRLASIEFPKRITEDCEIILITRDHPLGALTQIITDDPDLLPKDPLLPQNLAALIYLLYVACHHNPTHWSKTKPILQVIQRNPPCLRRWFPNFLTPPPWRFKNQQIRAVQRYIRNNPALIFNISEFIFVAIQSKHSYLLPCLFDAGQPTLYFNKCILKAFENRDTYAIQLLIGRESTRTAYTYETTKLLQDTVSSFNEFVRSASREKTCRCYCACRIKKDWEKTHKTALDKYKTMLLTLQYKYDPNKSLCYPAYKETTMLLSRWHIIS